MIPNGLNEEELVKFLENNDTYDDIVRFKKANNHHEDELFQYARVMDEDNNANEDYKVFFSTILFNEKKRKEKDDINVCESDDDDIDPQYELVLECLKEYGDHSYLLEGEKDGKTVVAKYEEDTNSDNEHDLEPRRKLSVKNTDEINAAQRIPMEKVVKVEYSSDDVNELDSDYDSFFHDFKIEDGYGVYKHKEHRVVYWKAEADDDEVDEGSSDDVEILSVNPSEMNMDNTRRSSVMVGEFRQLLMNVIRNHPYDKEEYNRLLKDFESRKPQLGHKDLRGGREISCPTGQEGKSYHDLYQDLADLLFLYKNDDPTSLNLLRGFFFWLQNVSHNGAFKPWKDQECMNIIHSSD